MAKPAWAMAGRILAFTTVMAGFFPLFFKQYWSAEVAATTSSFWLGLANALASLVIMLASPLLGAMADRGAKKRWLLVFSLLGADAPGRSRWWRRGNGLCCCCTSGRHRLFRRQCPV